VYFDPILGLLFALFGLAFGSFLNVCIYRLPRRIILLDEVEGLQRQDKATAELHEKRAELKRLAMWGTRSQCPDCQQTIAWYDNLPVLSWLLLAGRCRKCRQPISPRYVIVELLTAGLFVLSYTYFGVTISAVKFCALSFFAVGLVFTDAQWKLLPDALTWPGLALGIGFSLLTPVNDLGSSLFPVMRSMAGENWRLASLLQSVAGAIIGAAFIYGAGMLYLRTRPDLQQRGKQAMGMGDVKLMAMIGAYLGASLTIFTLFAASIAGAVFGVAVVLAVWIKRLRANREPQRAWRSAVVAFRFFQIPFGVFLASMAVVAGFLGNDVIRWYAGFFL
jgi:leader peptidase (prepilin peptidase)/N-methyltransferase